MILLALFCLGGGQQAREEDYFKLFQDRVVCIKYESDFKSALLTSYK